MKLSDVYADSRFGLSFELFPPKTEAGQQALHRHVAELNKHSPGFITCTYGAGGSTQAKTLDIVTSVKQQHSVAVASHLTCVGATVDQLRAYLTTARDRGIDHIVALRGDPPTGQTAFKPVPGGFHYASQLVSFIREEFPNFGIAVAGYPEKHQEAPTMEVDLQNLKHKVECGADVVVTQLFYDNADFFDFRDRCLKLGISVPLVPGLLPVTSLSQIQRITSMCGAKLPRKLIDRLGEKHDDADWQCKVGVEFAIAQVQQLIDAGTPGVHFYVLNKSQATGAVLQAVDLPS